MLRACRKLVLSSRNKLCSARLLGLDACERKSAGDMIHRMIKMMLVDVGDNENFITKTINGDGKLAKYHHIPSGNIITFVNIYFFFISGKVNIISLLLSVQYCHKNVHIIFLLKIIQCKKLFAMIISLRYYY